jgi:hypothetical protein
MSFLCWIGPGIFPSSPCKVVLGQPGWHTRDGFYAQVCVSRWYVHTRRFRGGPYVLASLIHVAHGRVWRELQVFVDSVLR